MSSNAKPTGVLEAQAAACGEAAEDARQSIGRYLRRQRELRGISLEELAELTRIPLRSLQRLEAGTFDGEVDGFVRGFVRTVSRALGLDPDDSVARMLVEPRLEDKRPRAVARLLPRALAAVLMLALLAVAVGLVRFVASEDAAAGSATGGQEPVYRRDPVRALAEAQAAVADSEPAPESAAPAALEAPPAP